MVLTASQAVMSIRLLTALYAHSTTDRRIFMRRTVSILVISEIRSGLESTHWRIEMTHQPRRLTTLELLIHEELEGSLLALHDTGSQEDEELLFRY
jgi:hypothetical protein